MATDPAAQPLGTLPHPTHPPPRKSHRFVELRSVNQAAARRGVLLIVLASVLWGTLGVGMKALYALAETNALSISFVRLAVAGPILLLYGRRALGRTPRVRRADGVLVVGSGIGMALSQVFFAAAVAESGVSIATLVTLCIAPVVVALCSAALLGERLSRPVFVALASAVLGTALLVGGQGGGGDEAGRWRGAVLGVLLALGAAVSYAGATLGQRALLGRYHPLEISALGLLAGAFALLPLGPVLGLTLAYPPAGWAVLAYLALVPTVVAYVLFLYGMRHASATTATIITLLESVVGMALAWLLFDERLGPLGLLGAVLLLGAIGLLYRGQPAE